MSARALAGGAPRLGRRPPPPPSSCRRRPAVVAARASTAPPPPPPLPVEQPQPANTTPPYGEYAWVRRAARRDPSRLLPYLSAENAFAAAEAAAAAAGQGADADADAETLASELGEWALSAAVGGLEEDEGANSSTLTYPDAPPLASSETTAAAAAAGRPPLRGKKARRALKPKLGPACARRVFGGEDQEKGLLPSVRDAELSACGRFLALLLQQRADGGGGPPLAVSVLCAETGATLAESGSSSSHHPLDAPLAWESQHVFYLALRGGDGELAVGDLSVGGGTGSGGGACSSIAPLPRSRHWARAALVRLCRVSRGPLFVVGWGPDGTPADALLVPSSSPAAALPAFAEEQEDDDDRRLALSLWGSDSENGPLWAVARRWSVGGGDDAKLYLGKVSPQHHHHWAPWAELPLPRPAEGGGGERLEAVLLPPPNQDAGANPPPYLITLSVTSGLSSELVARRFDLSVGVSGAATLALRAEARAGPGALLSSYSSSAAAETPLPFPPFINDPSTWRPAGADAWTLSNVAWDAGKQEVHADASAMGFPPRRLALSLSATGSATPAVVLLAATATPQWWAEAAASRAWPRLWRTVAPTADGARVPVTVLLPLRPSVAAPFPLLLTAYGAYGARESAGLSFDPAHEVLSRRGWAVAVAHVRGGAGVGGARLPLSGGDGGDNNTWRSAGRTAALKHLGSQDVLAAARHLVAQGVADPRRLCLSAQSAGAWVAVPAAAAAAAEAGDAKTEPSFDFRALLLTVPALCPFDEARAQAVDKDDEDDGPFPAAASDAYELGGGTAAVAEQNRSSWDPYASCCARLVQSETPRVLLRSALDDRVVGFWEALCFAARLRRLRGEGGGASAPSSSSVLLRTVPRGGHAAFAADGGLVGEEILALMFLLGSVGEV